MATTWEKWLAEEYKAPYFQSLEQFLKEEYQHYKIYPQQQDIFNAFYYTPYEKVKVVLLGQDPYHGEGQAHGLSFSVQEGVPVPPSLQNMYKELYTDLGINMDSEQGCLIPWATQGVLLLNTVLTVREGQAGSHRNKGWETLTDHAIAYLNQHDTPIVYLLFGKQAMAKQALIDTTKHTVITAAHPSPLSAYRGFFGSQPFSKANAALVASGQVPIQWALPAHE